MKKLLSALVLGLALTTSAYAQPVGNDVGPTPVPPACTSFGTTAGTCIQAAGSTAAPVFSTHNAVDQSVTSGVATKVTLGTVVTDTNSNFASSRFTATVPGYYHFDITVRGASGVAITAVEGWLYKNGAAYQKVVSQTTTSSGTVFSGSGEVQLAASDYVELYAAISGTTVSISFGDATNCTWLSGYWVRG